MEIRQNACICPDCDFRISTYGQPCSRLMELVANAYLNETSFILTQRESDDFAYKLPLQFMERNGFVVSTDGHNNCIQILPNLLKCSHDRQRSVLCWCTKDRI